MTCKIQPTISKVLGEQYLRMLTNDHPYRRSQHGGWQVEEYFSDALNIDHDILDTHIHSFTAVSNLEQHLVGHRNLGDNDHDEERRQSNLN